MFSLTSVLVIIAIGVIILLLTLSYMYVKATSVAPNYYNWDEIYKSLSGDSELDTIISTTKDKAINHFHRDFSDTKKWFEEVPALSTIDKHDKEILYSFFLDFVSVLEKTDLEKIGKDGEFTLTIKHSNGDCSIYHHWPYLYNSHWDMVMWKGEIKRGNDYLFYGLSTKPENLFWQIRTERELVGIDSSKGIINRQPIKK